MKYLTDVKLLEKTYEMYYDEYKNYNNDQSIRESKIYVPIDCSLIANKLNFEQDIVFGRFYYHLDKKFAYKQDDNSKVHFFLFHTEKEKNLINFPLLASVLADMKEQEFKFRFPIIISVIAIVISLVSVSVSLYSNEYVKENNVCKK